jgi:hypothetical protein
MRDDVRKIVIECQRLVRSWDLREGAPEGAHLRVAPDVLNAIVREPDLMAWHGGEYRPGETPEESARRKLGVPVVVDDDTMGPGSWWLIAAEGSTGDG